MTLQRFLGSIALLVELSSYTQAQTAINLSALRGLAPVTTLSHTAEGQAALGSNHVITGGIQTGSIEQPMLLPISEQQQQALRDVFITGGNLAQLADGLGTTLGAAYIARAHYIDRENFTSISEAVTKVIAYANAISGTDSNAAKYFFANATADGTKSVSAEALAILKTIGGSPDPFGRAYRHPAGTTSSNKYGNARPFQTQPSLTKIAGPDYFNSPSDNNVYNRGPMMDLSDSPSFSKRTHNLRVHG